MAEHAPDAVLTAAELAEMRRHVESGGHRMSGTLIEVPLSRDEALRLLATVEAYREIVAAVVGIREYSIDRPEEPYDAQISLLTITRARALLRE